MRLQSHVVVFDEHQKIKQIRLSWDQGSLLKQVGIIGASGRNWPLVDGKEQARLIAGATVGTVLDGTTERGRATDQVTVTSRVVSPSKKHIADPYSSLAKTGFAPEHDTARVTSPTPIAPRASAKPAPRDLAELFVNGEDGARPVSPTKENQPIAPKGAASVHRHQGARIFDDIPVEESPTARYKSDPKKYSHFELGHGEEIPEEPVQQPQARPISMRPNSKKHMSQWQFEDFSTPVKPGNKVRGHEVRHYGWSDDEGELGTSPGKNPHKANPRRDAEAHFTMQDTTPAAEKTLPATHAHRNSNLGLYNSHINEDVDPSKPEQEEEQKRPLSTVTNLHNRKKDFDSSWMTHDAPAKNGHVENKSVSSNTNAQSKHIKMMGANWSNYDVSPEQTKSENQRPVTRKRTNDERHWGFGDDEEGVTESKEPSNVKQSSAAGGGRSFWDF